MRGLVRYRSPRSLADPGRRRARFRVAREAGHTGDCALAYSRRSRPALRASCLCEVRARALIAAVAVLLELRRSA